MLTNDPYEYVLLFLDVIVHYVMLYMYAEKPNKFNSNSNIFNTILDYWFAVNLDIIIYLCLPVDASQLQGFKIWEGHPAHEVWF